MPKIKRFCGATVLFILAATVPLQAAVVQVRGTPSNLDAIDTLTVSDGAGAPNVAAVSNTVVFMPGASAQATRNRIVDSLLAKGVPAAGQGSEQFRVEVTSGATEVKSVKLNGAEIPFAPNFATAHSGQKYFRVPEKLPALTPLGLAALTLLLLGTAVYLFRKRASRAIQ